MHIVVVGVSHQSAPIGLRERLAFRPAELPEAYAGLRRECGVIESAILSTCNRVEIYARVPEAEPGLNRLHGFLGAHGRVAPDVLAPCAYQLADPNSVSHLFSVASGLESMVLGEGEILAQVKRAYADAREHGAAGRVFHVLFQKAINTAKAVRTETALSRGHASVGTVAVDLAKRVFGGLSGRCVTLVGAGKVGELTLKHLIDQGVYPVRIVNRSPERAQDLALAHGAVPLPWRALSAELATADILISSTAAGGIVIPAADIAEAMRVRHQQPLCLIDLGVPRNIDPAAGSLDNVYRFDIDDLQAVVERSVSGRQEAVAHSQAIVERKVAHFLDWWRQEPAPCANATARS